MWLVLGAEFVVNLLVGKSGQEAVTQNHTWPQRASGAWGEDRPHKRGEAMPCRALVCPHRSTAVW